MGASESETTEDVLCKDLRVGDSIPFVGTVVSIAGLSNDGVFRFDVDSSAARVGGLSAEAIHDGSPEIPWRRHVRGPSTVGRDTAREIGAFVEERRRGATAGPDARSSVLAEAMLADAVRTDPPRVLPTPAGDAERKAIPVWTGCVRYFPSALLEVAKVSKYGNDQHNPGQPLHWAQGKSMNQVDTCARHLLDADAVEGTAEEISHLAQAAWRILARLQLACQREGAPLAPGARTPGGVR